MILMLQTFTCHLWPSAPMLFSVALLWEMLASKYLQSTFIFMLFGLQSFEENFCMVFGTPVETKLLGMLSLQILDDWLKLKFTPFGLGFIQWRDRFTPDVMGALFTKAVLGWAVETILLKSSLFALGSSDAPLLDVVAYGGYSFIGVSVSVLASMLWSYAYYITLPWTSLCMANFLVRTMKRLLFAEARSYDRDSTRHHYLLLLMGVAQFPLFYWLVRVR